jgi:hypothetical protein
MIQSNTQYCTEIQSGWLQLHLKQQDSYGSFKKEAV